MIIGNIIKELEAIIGVRSVFALYCSILTYYAVYQVRTLILYLSKKYNSPVKVLLKSWAKN
jgi:hypothetical protein